MNVEDLFYKVAPRLGETSGVDLFQAINAAIVSCGKRLLDKRSDLVKKPLSVTFEAGPSKRMPDAFKGFVENPFSVIGVTNRELTPLRPEERVSLDKEGTPTRWELIGRRLYLFPYPAEDLTIKGRSYSLPSELTSLNDDLPWDGEFDNLLTEACTRICSIGLAHAVDPTFEAFIRQEMDKLLPTRTARPRRARGTHY